MECKSFGMFRQRPTDKLMQPVRDESAEDGEMFRDAHPAISHSKDREDDQRNGHRPGSLLRVYRFLRTRLTEKGQCDLAHRIECRHEGSNRQREKYCPMTMTKCIRQNFILRPETRRNERE